MLGGQLATFSISREETKNERNNKYAKDDAIAEEPVEWMDFGYISFGKFASLSRLMGTFKSIVVRDLGSKRHGGLANARRQACRGPIRCDVLYVGRRLRSTGP